MKLRAEAFPKARRGEPEQLTHGLDPERAERFSYCGVEIQAVQVDSPGARSLFVGRLNEQCWGVGLSSGDGIGAEASETDHNAGRETELPESRMDLLRPGGERRMKSLEPGGSHPEDTGIVR
jgi:hypothetical protein